MLKPVTFIYKINIFGSCQLSFHYFNRFIIVLTYLTVNIKNVKKNDKTIADIFCF